MTILFSGAAHIVNPIIGLAINVLFQLLGLRFVSSLGLLKSIFLGFLIGLLAVFCFDFYDFYNQVESTKDFLSILTTNLLTYSALGYCYFHFLNLGVTARRIRLLREIYDSVDGLSMNEILQCYNASNQIEGRLNRLLSSGQIICKNNKYFIGKPAMLFISNIIIAMKLIILGKKSEFD